MLALLFFTLALLAQVEAGRYDRGLRFGRRQVLNETVSSYTNTSTTTTTSSTTSSTTFTSTLTTTTPSNLTTSTSSSSSLPDTQPTKSANNGTTGEPGETCVGLVTYYGSVPPTVYMTVTEGFEVTITASNASVTESETLITPPPACESTIMPALGSNQPLATIVFSSEISVGPGDSLGEEITTKPGGRPNLPDLATATQPVGGPPKSPQAPPPAESQASQAPVFTLISSTVYATAPYTSTVVVTKKTPVVVVAPTTSSPPVFQDPTPNQNNNPGNQNPGGSNPPSPNAPTNDNPPQSNGPANDNPPSPGPSPGPAIVLPGPGATTAGIGNVIVSLIKTQPFASAPVTPQTTIANVPVAVLPSSILLGSSTIAIPQSSQAIATVGGQVFTVRPSEIVASDTTIALAPFNVIQAAPASTYTADVTIAPGIVAQVSGSAAVIDGTTYRIGFGATPTTITVDGVPVGIGPYGLTLPSKTVAANALTDSPMVVESAGGLVFSIDQSQVVVDGTTYRIGSGAPTITTEIDGQKVSIGPGGVGLETTTLKPTSVDAKSGSRTTGGAEATSSVDVADSGVRVVQRLSIKEMLGWSLIGTWLAMFL